MSDIAQTHNPASSSVQPTYKKRRSRPGRIIRFFAFTGLILVCILILLVIFTETAFFRNWLRERIVSTARDNLNATLSIGDIGGNILTGITIADIRLDTHEGELLSCNNVSVRYDLLQLPFKAIRVQELALADVRIRLIRNSNGVWNFAHLSKDTSASTNTGLNGWTLVLRNIRLDNAHILMFDSTNQTVPLKRRFTTGDLDVSDLHFSLNAIISDQSKKLSINQLGFDIADGDFSLRNLAGDKSRDEVALLFCEGDAELCELLLVLYKVALELIRVCL